MDSSALPSKKGEVVALVGAVLQIGSVIGTVIAMAQLRESMGSLNSSGISNPSQLADALGAVNITLAFSLIASIAGLIFLCIALVSLRCRARWFFWFLVTYSWLLLLGFPIGTAAGVFFLIYTLTRRSEFQAPSREPA